MAFHMAAKHICTLCDATRVEVLGVLQNNVIDFALSAFLYL